MGCMSNVHTHRGNHTVSVGSFVSRGWYSFALAHMQLGSVIPTCLVSAIAIMNQREIASGGGNLIKVVE